MDDPTFDEHTLSLYDNYVETTLIDNPWICNFSNSIHLEFIGLR